MESDHILHYPGRHYIPKLMIPISLEYEHDSKLAGHFGQEKTIELVERNIWWPRMETDMTAYIQA